MWTRSQFCIAGFSNFRPKAVVFGVYYCKIVGLILALTQVVENCGLRFSFDGADEKMWDSV